MRVIPAQSFEECLTNIHCPMNVCSYVQLHHLTMALQKYLAGPPMMTPPQVSEETQISNKMLPSLKSLPRDLARASTLG